MSKSSSRQPKSTRNICAANIGVFGKTIIFERRRYDISMTSNGNDAADIPQRQEHRPTTTTTTITTPSPTPAEFHHEIANHYRDFKYYKKAMIPYSYNKLKMHVAKQPPPKKRKHSKKMRALFRRFYKRKIGRRTFRIPAITFPR